MVDYRPDKFKVAQSFAAAAGQYDDVAVLQRQTADELLDRLSLMKIKPRKILDLGAGTGRNLALLHQRYPDAQLIAMDIAPGMLNQAKKRFRHDLGLKRLLPKNKPLQTITGDAESLPLADNSIDLVFANLALQWCDPRQSFHEIQRVLKADGLLMFTSLGPDTLTELRQAWAAADAYPHVNVFYDMHDVGDAMMASGLADCVLDVEPYTLTYETAMTMMRDLKILGAHNVNEGRRRGLTGKDVMKNVIKAYEQFRHDGLIPASYEVVFGHGWKITQRGQQSSDDGSVHIPINEIQRR
ncbi:malonyl-ACP O-methyltransferase BioC [Methylophaga sp.]|uniref:malonyl-ACP O-methyltransferase BioC n=1 Tax=Methylophaga sp. TaxID=2024840 RepID=UPI003F6A3503